MKLFKNINCIGSTHFPHHEIVYYQRKNKFLLRINYIPIVNDWILLLNAIFNYLSKWKNQKTKT